MDEWKSLALCRGEDVRDFYSHEEEDRTPIPDRIRGLCESCPVNEACLEYAIKNENYGFWAGTTARERKNIRRERADLGGTDEN